jgi:hypothetical protein
LRWRQPARQFQQRERIPARLSDDPLQHALIQPSRQGGLQQRPRITTPQRPDVQLREARERLAQLAGREHQRDPLRQQAASHEPKRTRRRPIEPLRVIDNTKERPLLGGLRQQAEDRQSDQERIGGRPGTASERDGKRLALRIREALGELQDRRAQLLQRRERELHLPLDPSGAGGPKLPPRLDRVLQQGGLADARLSVHHQDPAVPAAGGLQQPFEHLALTLPAEQQLPWRPGHHPNPATILRPAFVPAA